ncbi:MAG: nucleotide sugar dehydrogenase [Acetobacteraceae bacterium]|nr:nucleotide sugar dehydrogenase [Acetobacteraceae bacterium]
MDLCVVGLGKLGAPLAAVLASVGHRVVGVDLNPAAVQALNEGRAPVAEPGLQERLAMAGGRLRATTDFADAIPASDLSFVIVPTPSGANGMFSNRYVVDAVRRIGTALRGTDRYHVVNITSTVMPGATGGEIRAALEAASGRVVGQDVGLTYNPEFIALGSVVRDLLQPDMVLIGESDPRAGDLLAAAYRLTVPEGTPVQRMNWACAELTKIAVNTYVTTKISYANMIAEMCDRLPGADAEVVTQALGRDSRIGAKYLKSALGYGGPCFPRDNVALAALARALGTRADVAEATDAVNRRQVERVVGLVARLAPQPATVAVLGLSYKPDTPVVDESQGVMIARALAIAGYSVLVADPVALDSAIAVMGESVTPMGTAEAAVREAGIVVITTPDRAFAALPAACFAGGKVVLDCWRILPAAVAEIADVVHLGRGPAG